MTHIEPPVSMEEAAAIRYKLRQHPLDMIYHGMVKIKSTGEVTKDGEFVESQNFTKVQRLVPTENQQRILDWCQFCLDENKPIWMDMLKKRQEGFTTICQAIASCFVQTVDGYGVLDVSHKPDSAKSIYNQIRFIIKNMPGYMGVPKTLTYDSKEFMQIRNPFFGIEHSIVTCRSCKPESIEALHGQNFDGILYSEASRYEQEGDLQRFFLAIGPIAKKSNRLMNIKETTSNGHDQFFYPSFTEAWEAQGKKNYWESGSKARSGRRLALFCPAYTNQTCSQIDLADTPGGMKGLQALYEDLQPYEQWLLVVAKECWMERGRDEKTALVEALRHIYWRRCKLPSIYNSTSAIELVYPGSDPYPNITTYQRMEPNTVDEAFEAIDNDNVLSPANIVFLEKRARVWNENGEKGTDYPKLRGEFNEDATFSARTDLDAFIKNHKMRYRMEWSFWKDPSECSGNIYFIIDFAEGKFFVDKGEFKEPGDFTHCIVVDRTKREMIGEYISQQPAHKCAEQIIRAWTWLRNNTGAPGGIGWERRHSAAIASMAMDVIPLDCIYFDVDSADPTERDMSKIGYWPSQKTAVVDNGVEWISYERWVNRSDVIAHQAKFYVYKTGGKIEAMNKDGVGPSSKDDGITCALLFGYIEKRLPDKSVGFDWFNEAFEDGEKKEDDVIRRGSIVAGDVEAFLRFEDACDEAGVDSENVNEIRAKGDAPFDSLVTANSILTRQNHGHHTRI